MISTCCPSNSELLEAKVPQEDVGKLYDRTAWFYDIWASLTESKAQKRAIEIAEVQNKTTILDVAAGTGLYERIYRISPPLMGGCRGVQMFDLLTEHGFKVITREYVQQMLFPSEVILATK